MNLTKAVGDAVPNVKFRTRREEQWLDIDAQTLFANQSVVVFGLPGAFTPTCSGSQVPTYDAYAQEFKALGVDRIVCISVNDGFVMDAWAKSLASRHVQFVADGNGEFTEKMGLLTNKQDLGFGLRSRRYSMWVVNGIIKTLFVEPAEPGDPYKVSDPLTMLQAIKPGWRKPDDLVMVTRANCGHCQRARNALQAQGMAFEEIAMTPGWSNRTLFGLTGQTTTPQVFINGRYIGDADALIEWLKVAA